MTYIFWKILEKLQGIQINRYFDTCQTKAGGKESHDDFWLVTNSLLPLPGRRAPDPGSAGSPHVHFCMETSPSRASAWDIP